MTQENFLNFLKYVVKHSKSTEYQPVMLLLDNHESHLSFDCIQFPKDNEIYLLSFLPQCSNRLPPLDCSVYFPLERFYNALCDAWCNSHPDHPIEALDILAICSIAFTLAMTP